MRRLLALVAGATLFVASVASAAEWQKLLTPAGLETLADDGGVTVLDIRSPREYATAHVPGAVNVPYPAWRGPKENPGKALSDKALTAAMQAGGLEPDSRVVITHAGINPTDFGAAARVYWTLKSAGLSEIAILNGGVRGWIAEGRELSVDPAKVEPSKATFTLSDEWMVGRAEVTEIVAGARQATLIDARTPEFFKGEKKHAAAETPGTIPGSENFVYDSWFTASETEISTGERIAELAASAPGSDAAETVSFCNTGHWAAINWFALSELAGRENVRLYPESAVGWVNAGRPVEPEPKK